MEVDHGDSYSHPDERDQAQEADERRRLRGPLPRRRRRPAITDVRLDGRGAHLPERDPCRRPRRFVRRSYGRCRAVQRRGRGVVRRPSAPQAPTQITYRSAIDHNLPSLHDRPVGRITYGEVQSLVNAITAAAVAPRRSARRHDRLRVPPQGASNLGDPARHPPRHPKPTFQVACSARPRPAKSAALRAPRAGRGLPASPDRRGRRGSGVRTRPKAGRETARSGLDAGGAAPAPCAARGAPHGREDNRVPAEVVAATPLLENRFDSRDRTVEVLMFPDP